MTKEIIEIMPYRGYRIELEPDLDFNPEDLDHEIYLEYSKNGAVAYFIYEDDSNVLVDSLHGMLEIDYAFDRAKSEIDEMLDGTEDPYDTDGMSASLNTYLRKKLK